MYENTETVTTLTTQAKRVEETSTTESPLQRKLLENLTTPLYNVVKEKGFCPCGEYFKLRKSKISDIPKNFPISGTSICSGNHPKVLFVVPSVANAKDFKNRLDIRETWASDLYRKDWQQTSRARLVFFFGSSGLKTKELEGLKNESAKYGDIVVAEFHDTYHNLSLKMAVTFTWVAQFCSKVETVIKADMDTFVNVDLMLRLVKKLPISTHPKLVFGKLHVSEHPPALRKGAWAVPESVYPYDEFPRYLYGPSYVVSGPAVRLMAESFPFFPIVPNEDAFVTGVMPAVLNITRFFHKSFATPDYEKDRTYCRMVQNEFVSTLVIDEKRAKLWAAFKTKQCLHIVIPNFK
ncbi:beta-1,3-galactosyltransferase 1-like [Elysia marginata]|uniref:Hexosyltransferase n=1 Tax=Elysia marginata TaxID=1093978 RepID=A0AAV4HPM6_9GAST|nr:beta-1,3-galactosyltransferase 1-like [Elysia marginata]